MLRFIFGFTVITLIFQFNYQVKAQRVKLIPSDSNLQWYNLEEWIYINSNLSYDSYDLVSFNIFTPGWSNKFDGNTLVYVNGNRLETRWLNQSMLSFPNLNLSEIDSVLIDYASINRFNSYAPNGTIEIYTRKHINSVSVEHKQINQVNDPGPFLSSQEETPNVELLKYETNSTLNLNISGLSSSIIYSKEDYNRTNQLVYEREANSTLLDRTLIRSRDGISLPNRKKFMYGAFSDLTTSFFTLKSSLIYNNLQETYIWHPLSGIEVPSSIDQYQFSSTFHPTNAAIYNGSSFNLSLSTSDTLNYTPIVFYGLKEIRFSHNSSFQFQIGGSSLSTSVHTQHYSVNDRFTEEMYQFLEYGLTSLISFSGTLNFLSMISNKGHVFELTKSLRSSYIIKLNTSTLNHSKTHYSYKLWNQGIGFSSLNKEEHSVLTNSSFKQIWSEIRLVRNSNNNLTGFIFVKHNWTTPIENIQYRVLENSFKLNSDIEYADAKNIGLAGVQSFYKINLSPQLLSRTMFGTNIYLYGNGKFKDYHEKVPNLVFSQQIQYKPDENLSFELFFRYLPVRRINEYQNLEELIGWPPVQVKPIRMLNASVNMWFFNRFLELNLTLRNLLNSTESYNTNGQYYNLSMNISGKINFTSK
ncbi:hypothetical protein [Gracilimonas sp. BCB1]|uniref:hypothetical protein n=1 Tax=Gracilimonas sp. BCB1 TaxID=3152362 RepID=UPI0032D94CFD